MAITSDFNFERIQKETQQQADVLDEKILNSFIYAGETFVKNAREQMQDHAMNTYLDQTTNLRNSIGYFVFHNGRLVSDQGKMQSPGELSMSVQNIHAIADVIKPDAGFQLIGIAGMNYASYVESKGYNVISYQADICMVDLAEYLEILEQVEQGTAANMDENFLRNGKL